MRNETIVSGDPSLGVRILRKTAPKGAPIPKDTKNDVDVVFGVVYIVCMIFGTPANFLSFLFFMKQKTMTGANKAFIIYLYRMITFTDTVICFLAFALIEASLESLAGDKKDPKDPLLFGDPTFCFIWGLLWNVLSVLSVFLVAILSFSRCLLLLHPLKQLNIKATVTFLVVAALLITAEKLVAQFSAIEGVYDDVEYRYLGKHVTFCYLTSRKFHQEVSNYDSAQSFLFLILLGFPVIPILGSFIVSVHKLRIAEKNESKLFKSITEKSKHHGATITVVIVTGLYIICHIPVLICHLYFAIYLIVILTYLSHHTTTDRDHRAQISVAWTVFFTASYALLVVFNSCLNPVIYFTRMKVFRDYVIKQKNRMFLYFRSGFENLPVELRMFT